MRHKAKVSCACLVAVLALNFALGTGVAHGNNITAESGAATLNGRDRNTEHGKLVRMTFGNGARFVECTNATLNSSITGPTTVVTMGTNFTKCWSNGLTAVPATVITNGCDFVFEATKKSVARTSVKCAKENEQIEVHIYESEARHKKKRFVHMI